MLRKYVVLQEGWEKIQNVFFWAVVMNTRVILHVLEVFSALCDLIDLISFSRSQASWNTNVDYKIFFRKLWKSTFSALTQSFIQFPPKRARKTTHSCWSGWDNIAEKVCHKKTFKTPKNLTTSPKKLIGYLWNWLHDIFRDQCIKLINWFRLRLFWPFQEVLLVY